ncbi:MAG: stage II sporulation protein R, partial [Clostridiales bacterium]|nr:stage II sporulation protein R [Clostridiales bacterium]
WWCVMYPNLCFSGSLYEVDEESGELLRAELTAEEYAAVFSEGDYEVEFKILKFLNQVLE